MQGIQFLIDANGQKTAVVIDLKEYGELWEDFYDVIVAHSRQDEPRESLEEVRQQLLDQGKLSE
ncbi:MAG: hypothetical protein HC769_06430 [Cyanobacteria bacterium CRU_2_1]|nr:hypothetical protein [Cyanobacteria bacterium RU_5_0]NJR58484.1 hypothetical protein [Cyanobacteria bacterium CRU_2_1]NJR58518.1 hypothetical protein [Cyanobacteria bacterium CRU_2_1]